MLEVTLLVEPCNVFTAAVKDLGLDQGFLVQFAWALDALGKCFY